MKLTDEEFWWASTGPYTDMTMPFITYDFTVKSPVMKLVYKKKYKDLMKDSVYPLRAVEFDGITYDDE